MAYPAGSKSVRSSPVRSLELELVHASSGALCSVCLCSFPPAPRRRRFPSLTPRALTPFPDVGEIENARVLGLSVDAVGAGAGAGANAIASGGTYAATSASTYLPVDNSASDAGACTDDHAWTDVDANAGSLG